jgi:hypothetical protein
MFTVCCILKVQFIKFVILRMISSVYSEVED